MNTPLDLSPLLALVRGFGPVILVGASGAGALSVAVTVLEQVAARRQRARAALASILLLVSPGVIDLLVAWRGFLMLQASSIGRPYVEFAGLEEGAGLLALLDRVPPYALALGTFGVTLAVPALLGPAQKPGRVKRRNDREHPRQAKAELIGRRGEDAVIVVLAWLGLPALHDVILRNEHGLMQVDHLVRLPDGIAVLETKTYAALVTGRPWAKEWTQHLGTFQLRIADARGGKMQTAFQNPLLQNYRHVEAVRHAVGADVPVHGLVVSAGTARFCPELVEAVVPLAELAVQLASLPTEACDDAMLGAAWHKLTIAAARSRALQAAHLEQVQGRCIARTGATCA